MFVVIALQNHPVDCLVRHDPIRPRQFGRHWFMLGMVGEVEEEEEEEKMRKVSVGSTKSNTNDSGR